MSVVDQQLARNDCGISAIKTCYNIFNVNISRDYIKDHIHLDEKGASFKELKSFFENNGFNANFKLIEFDNDYGNIEYLKSIVPFVVPTKKKNELHYIIVNKIKKNKLQILDPAKSAPYFASFSEFNKQVFQNVNHIELVNIEDKLTALANSELKKYQLRLDKALLHSDIAAIYNKVIYFSHIRDNYGFKSVDAEKDFFTDLLFNQELSKLPKQFRSLRLQNDFVAITAPLVLSVKPDMAIIKDLDLPVSENENIFFKLIKSLGSEKKLWYIYIFTALFSATISQLTVFINQILIDSVLPSFQINILIIFAISVGLFRLLGLVISQYKNFVAIHLGNMLDKYFLSVFDNKLNYLSISYIQSFRRGDLTERLSDSLRLKRFFVRFFSRILVDLFVAIYSLFILFFINWQLALIVSVGLVLFYFWFKIITPYLKSAERVRFQKKADLFSKMIEKIDGLQVIKSFNLEKLISDKIQNSIDNLIHIQTKVRYINLVNTAVVSIITLIASLSIIVLLAKESILHQNISLGQIITFIMLSGRVFKSLSKLLKENLALQEHEVILRRFFDFDEIPDSEKHKGGSIRKFQIETLTLKNINFNYSPDKPIIKDLDLQIKHGDKIRIFGKNGSGKSTMAKILSLLYVPNSGLIEINDTALSFYNVQKLREKILLVSNEDILFNETIEFNITLGQKISSKKIIEYAKVIDFYDLISNVDGGLNFMISEGGKNLSTGQRKKILILRALLSKSELIILDEVLSGIDADARTKIEFVLNMVDTSLIIVSHEPINNINFNKEYIIKNGSLSKL